VRSEKLLIGVNATRGIQRKNNMKLREHRLAHRAQGSITNQEIVRARAVTAELKLNIKKAYELTHMAEESPPCFECALKELSATMCSNP
jgi:hypothetical protein